METLVESEGDGWLLPRFSPAPWEQFVRDAWQVADETDLQWILARLRPTPYEHFTEPLHLQRSDDERPRRTYIRCRSWPNPSFDRYAAAARSSPEWTYRELTTSHLPYITHPAELAEVLIDVAV